MSAGDGRDAPSCRPLPRPSRRAPARPPAGERARSRADLGAALQTGVALEVNGLPARLDLSGRNVRLALEAGVTIVSTDAHSVAGPIDNMRLSVHTARRGGARAGDVLNTRPLEHVLRPSRTSRHRGRAGPGGYRRAMPSAWPSLSYEDWSETCDTLHAHTQVLGKLAAALAPPEPQLQHAALRLTARGWETRRCRPPTARGRSSSRSTCAPTRRVVEHSDGRAQRVALTPDRPVGEVTRELLGGRRARSAAPSRSTRRRRRSRGPCRSTRTTSTRRYDPDAGRRLLRRRHPGGARAGRVPRAVPRPLDAGQRLVGLVRPRRQPLLRAARRAAVARTSSCATRWTPRRSPSAGGRATRATAAPPSTPTPTPRPTGSPSATLSPAAARWDGDARRVRPRLGRRLRERRPARDGARVRPLGLPPRLPGLRLGSRARGDQPEGDPPPVR